MGPTRASQNHPRCLPGAHLPVYKEVPLTLLSLNSLSLNSVTSAAFLQPYTGAPAAPYANPIGPGPVISFCPKQHHHTPVVPMVQFGTYPAAAESAVVSTGPELGPTQPVHNMEGRLGRSPARRHTRASRGAPTTLANTDPTNFQAMLRQFTGDPAGPYANPTGPGPVISFCQQQQHHHAPVVTMGQFGPYPAAAESAVVSTGPEPGPTLPVHNIEGRKGRSPARRHTRATHRPPTTLLNTDHTNFQAMVQQFPGASARPYANPTGPGPGPRPINSFCPQQHPHAPVVPMGQFGPYPATAHHQQYVDRPAAIVPEGNVTDGFLQGGFTSSVASNGGSSITTTAMGPATQGSGDINLVTAMGLLGCLVAFAAGYITTETGQHALKAAAAARPFPPIDIFVCSVIISLFTLIAAGRFPGFQQCFSAFFIMLASSSVAHFILHHRPFVWLVYVPCVVHVMYVFLYNPLSARIHQLFTHIRNRA